MAADSGAPKAGIAGTVAIQKQTGGLDSIESRPPV
jgi:hypothetical protein